MKAVLIVPGEEGGHVAVADVAEPPELSAGKVLVRVHAAALNRGELIVLANARSGEPRVNGVEFSGEIVEVGAGVTEWLVGDQVMGHGAQSMAEYVAVDQRALFSKPDSMSWVEAAAIPNVFVTAHDAMVTHGGVTPDSTVLINAASSGIGTASIQIARFIGAAKIIGLSRTAGKFDQLRPLGTTHLITTDQNDWVSEVMELTDGNGVSLIIDSLGAEPLAENLKAMALCGRLINVGRITGKTAEIDLDLLSLRRIEVIGVTFRTRTADETLSCVEAARSDLQEPIDRGEIVPVVDSVFPMADITQAHSRLASNQQIGKIVITICHSKEG